MPEDWLPLLPESARPAVCVVFVSLVYVTGEPSERVLVMTWTMVLTTVDWESSAEEVGEDCWLVDWGTSFELDEGVCLDDELLGVGVSELVVTAGGFVEEELLELGLDSDVVSAGAEDDV